LFRCLLLVARACPWASEAEARTATPEHQHEEYGKRDKRGYERRDRKREQPVHNGRDDDRDYYGDKGRHLCLLHLF
jgi:hypothetical protein